MFDYLHVRGKFRSHTLLDETSFNNAACSRATLPLSSSTHCYTLLHRSYFPSHRIYMHTHTAVCVVEINFDKCFLFSMENDRDKIVNKVGM
jgi:hypothetical protein